ncbi:hypothetical protein CN317_13390 [Bacillus cereus]|nr:hypothetical protein CN317_13390 [Bacillus cereus]
MSLEIFQFVFSQVITGIGVYFTYKSYKHAKQKATHRNSEDTFEIIDYKISSTDKKIKQVLNFIPSLIALFFCAFIAHSLYNNLSIIQNSPLISFNERETMLSIIARVISNGVQTFGLFIYAFIILYAILFIIKYSLLQRPFKFISTPIQILFCIATIFLTYNIAEISLQIELGNLLASSIENKQVTPLNDLSSILSTMSPILILVQIFISMFFFVELMKNFHTNQQFLTSDLKKDEFKITLTFILLTYFIIFHTPFN